MRSRKTTSKAAASRAVVNSPNPGESLAGPHFCLEAQPAPSPASRPLFVDLDGTLIATDLLFEAIALSARSSARLIWKLPWWLVRGRAYLKNQLSAQVIPDAASLPYRAEVVAWLRREKSCGRKLILATASPSRWAVAVAEHLGLFDAVLASDGDCNLKGQRKQEAIGHYCRQHGHASFDYAGDAAADLPIWERASEVYVVSAGPRLLRRVQRLARPVQVLAPRDGRLSAVLQALRSHQWLKNLLLCVPLLLAHQFQLPKVAAVLTAVAAFCLAASGVYLVNDWLDVAADRRHPRKRSRPFASGRLPLSWGPPWAAGCVLAGTGLALAVLPWSFVGLLGLYLLLTCCYSLWLKQRPIVDVMLLAGLYTLRILAGGAASQIAVSEWLLAFSVFMFTSLAFAKRYAELTRLETEGGTAVHGRGYFVSDREIIRTLGPAAGYLAVMVLALYMNSEAVRQLYVRPWALWATAGLLLYWITRTWFLAARGQLCEDPVVFAITDRVSRAILLASGILIVLAAMPGMTPFVF